MRKNMLTLCAAVAMVLGASFVFAANAAAEANCVQAVPETPCVKSDKSDAAAVAAYEACMAEFIGAQNKALANHQAAISRAEAAVEQSRTGAGGENK